MRSLIVLLLLTSTALADPAPHPIDMTTVLTDENHHPIKDQFERTEADPSCAKCSDLTLGNAIAHALFFVGGDEKDVTPEQKWAWAAFADRIRDDKAATLTNAQSALVEKRMGRLYGGIVLMRVMPILDPNRKPPEIE